MKRQLKPEVPHPPKPAGKRRSFIVALVAMLISVLGLITGAGVAQAGPLLNSGCQLSSLMKDISVQDHGLLGVKIIVTPTNAARLGSGPGSDETNSIWASIQSCVPNLYGTVADSVYQQLDCHVLFGQAEFATGPTWDFETWRVALDNPNPASYASSHCLNDQPTRLDNDLIYVG